MTLETAVSRVHFTLFDSPSNFSLMEVSMQRIEFYY